MTQRLGSRGAAPMASMFLLASLRFRGGNLLLSDASWSSSARAGPRLLVEVWLLRAVVHVAKESTDRLLRSSPSSSKSVAIVVEVIESRVIGAVASPVATSSTASDAAPGNRGPPGAGNAASDRSPSHCFLEPVCLGFEREKFAGENQYQCNDTVL
eukprot:CAMPEP_0172379510 /NCGR_PEP_ID=MMETSP1060-20121228/69969_1 /TAXON_ID=37318 /ORGANISM="Pseudo-nitzschia pungens, Strain cf. cingulata" /LENGTH=155 /DNA_ID=CAMNT_0013107251 /DNA_START=502 /DNA_END=969 /DNA_ORIENTATION=+